VYSNCFEAKVEYYFAFQHSFAASTSLCSDLPRKGNIYNVVHLFGIATVTNLGFENLKKNDLSIQILFSRLMTYIVYFLFPIRSCSHLKKKTTLLIKALNQGN
jgi:hypothetical protein